MLKLSNLSHALISQPPSSSSKSPVVTLLFPDLFSTCQSSNALVSDTRLAAVEQSLSLAPASSPSTSVGNVRYHPQKTALPDASLADRA